MLLPPNQNSTLNTKDLYQNKYKNSDQEFRNNTLLNKTTYENNPNKTCTGLEKTYVDDWAFTARTVLTSKAFEECIKQKVIIQDKCIPCAEDPPHNTPQQSLDSILLAARNVTKIEVGCDNGTHGNASAGVGTFGNYDIDSFRFHGWLDAIIDSLGILDNPNDDELNRFNPFPWPITQGAGIIPHEAMHQ